MAVATQTTTRTEINGDDISAYVKKVSLVLNGEEVDITTFSSAGWKTVLGGLKSWAVSIEFLNDFAASALDADLFSIFGTVVTCKIRVGSGLISTSNPEYQGSVLINQLTPIDVTPGTVSMMSVTWPGSGVPTRATSS